MTIPADKVSRWTRQAQTHYAYLTTIANDMQARNEYLEGRLADAEHIIQRHASQYSDLHAQVTALQSAVHYWRERALRCAELEPEGT